MTSHPLPDAALDDRLVNLHTIIVDGIEVIPSVLDRILAKRQIVDDCWIWCGYTRSGYGSISVHNTQVRIPRIIATWCYGPIPAGMSALHHCDTPKCFRPNHIFLGSQIDNINDMRAKSRGINPQPAFGMNNFNAHLSDAEIAALRAASHGATQREIARQFGVSQSTVWRLIHGVMRAI